MRNNAIIDYPCVSQFYLLKLVMGNQRATGMKFGRMRSIEFSVGKKTKDGNRNAERQTLRYVRICSYKVFDEILLLIREKVNKESWMLKVKFTLKNIIRDGLW